MATCPECGANSRSDNTFQLTAVRGWKPPASFGLAGVATKFVLVERYRLSHGGCGWSVVGSLTGDAMFTADPPEEHHDVKWAESSQESFTQSHNETQVVTT